MTVPPVDILSLATAVPGHVVSQDEAQARAKAYFKHLGYMEAVFANSGVATRRSCVPVEWYLSDHDWKERTDLFLEHGVALLEQVACTALADAGARPQDVGAVLTVTSTGIAIPSLDALLANRIGLAPSVERSPIFGLGCAGGAAGLARAARMAATMPGKPVLLLVVELCGINFRLRDLTKTNFVTTALFGDGAAGLVLRASDDGSGGGRARIMAFSEHQWPDTESVMGFTVETDGLGVVLRSDVPAFTRDKLRPVVDAFLEQQHLGLEDFAGFLFHPGGARVLDAIAGALDLDADGLPQSRVVLERYGNMSSPTVLFVLKQAMDEGAAGRHLLGAFGPGFFAALAILELTP